MLSPGCRDPAYNMETYSRQATWVLSHKSVVTIHVTIYLRERVRYMEKKRNEVEKRGKRDRKKRIFQKPIVAVNVTKDRAVLRTVFEQRISKTDSLPFSERNILFGYLPFDVLCWLSWHRDYWPGSQQVIEHLHVRGEYRV